MFLSQATFGREPFGVEDTGLHDRVESYLDGLKRNGQICGEPLQAICDNMMVAYVYLVRPDSIAPRFHSRYAIDDLNKLRDVFGQEPVWRILADKIPKTFPDISDASALCMCSSGYDGESPFCFMETGSRIPSYLIPMDIDEREKFLFWSREFNRMERVWFCSGELEIPAYEQIASPTSLPARQGRELAALVGAALEKPVYYFLDRYYGRGAKEVDRCCPGCGAGWRRKSVDEYSRVPWNAPFRCDICRLVSKVADADYDDSYAHIGEFLPRD